MSKRRRFKFSACSRLGVGASCHRCEAATNLTARAKEVEEHFAKIASAKNDRPKNPVWLFFVNGEFLVRGFTKTFSVKDTKDTVEIGKLFGMQLRAEAQRLTGPQAKKGQKDRIGASAEVSLADQVT